MQDRREERNVQAEIRLLQKRCRMLESSRAAHVEDPQRTISQQQKMIEKLKQENKALKDEVNLVTKVGTRPQTRMLRQGPRGQSAPE